MVYIKENKLKCCRFNWSLLLIFNNSLKHFISLGVNPDDIAGLCFFFFFLIQGHGPQVCEAPVSLVAVWR